MRGTRRRWKSVMILIMEEYEGKEKQTSKWRR
jgi:hypothetical protein